MFVHLLVTVEDIVTDMVMDMLVNMVDGADMVDTVDSADMVQPHLNHLLYMGLGSNLSERWQILLDNYKKQSEPSEYNSIISR